MKNYFLYLGEDNDKLLEYKASVKRLLGVSL